MALGPEVVKAAVPLVLRGICARKAGPSQKETIPVGVPEPAGLDATVAVKVTGEPDAGTEKDRVVVVAFACTFCIRVALPAWNVESPLYVAIMKWLPK